MPPAEPARRTLGPRTAAATSPKQRSPRLRAACNECNAAKIKCTGERHGCQRCQANPELTCVYGQSRVGKVPGIRAKKAPPADRAAAAAAAAAAASSQQTSDAGASGSASRGTSIRSLPNHSDDAFAALDSFDDALADDWDASLPSALHAKDDLAMHSYRSPLSQGALAPSDSLWSFEDPRGPSHDRPMIDAHIDADFPAPSPLGPGLAAAAATAAAAGSGPYPDEPPSATRGSSASHGRFPLKRRRRPQVPLKSRIVQTCCQLVLTLESYIGADVQAFDILLSALKKALETLKRLLPLHVDASTAHIHGLLGVIMCQVVQLFEVCCTDFLASQTEDDEDNADDAATRAALADPRSQAFALPGAELRGIADGFASFSFGLCQPADLQEQHAWNARVILRELQLACELSQQILAVGRLGRQQQPWPDAEPQECFQDLQRRLQLLCDDVRKASRA